MPKIIENKDENQECMDGSKNEGKKKHYYLVSLAASRVSVAANTIDDKRK